MQTTPISWTALLADAIRKPGSIHAAYTRFHHYSMGNQLLALFQCAARGIEPGPLGTFLHWKQADRHVKKGAKALTLCMPVNSKRRGYEVPAGGESDWKAEENDGAVVFTRFIYRPHWFVLAQTEGAPYAEPALPEWSKALALAALEIREIPFDALDGNTQGFARKRTVAVSAIAGQPWKTLFHELAHVVLGHTAEADLTDSDHTPRSLREVEAEAVALLCSESLGMPGAEFCRGYIQHWGSEIPERSAQKIFHAADQILKAGRPATEKKESVQ